MSSEFPFSLYRYDIGGIEHVNKFANMGIMDKEIRELEGERLIVRMGSKCWYIEWVGQSGDAHYTLKDYHIESLLDFIDNSL